MDKSAASPPPSWLYHIPPKGGGTCEIESLTGYISRLAKAHLVTPATLVHRGLEWWDVGQPQRVGEWKRRTTRLKLTWSLNAHNTSERWVELLERLTCVDGLAECTMRGWSGLFPDRCLLRHHLAWCSECFSQDSEPYDRLSWCIPPVKVCTKHRCRLVERCVECGSLVPVIHARSAPGRCPRCFENLSQPGMSVAFANEEEMRIAELTTEFLGAVNRAPYQEIKRTASAGRVLRACMASAGVCDAAQLASLLNVSRITAWYWVQDRSVPTFPHTLSICNIFGLSVMNFLNGVVRPKIVPRGLGELPLRAVRRSPRFFDEVLVAREINTYCEEQNHRPPSMNEVASRLGFAARVLRQHFPQRCREISQNHRKFLKEELARRKETLRTEMRAALMRCRSEKWRPRRSDVVQFLPKAGVLRSAAARATLDQLLLEMNCEPHPPQ